MFRRRTALEDHLVRKSVDMLSHDREGCCRCGRTPLTGEHVMRSRDGRVLCELCRPMTRIEDAREEVVRLSEHGQTVRAVRRIAA